MYSLRVLKKILTSYRNEQDENESGDVTGIQIDRKSY